jgi:hypothetical protein
VRRVRMRVVREWERVVKEVRVERGMHGGRGQGLVLVRSSWGMLKKVFRAGVVGAGGLVGEVVEMLV